MSDTFSCLSLEQLLIWLKQEEPCGRLFGIPKSLFFVPAKSDVFRMKRYGRLLESPVGVAAGPHTQLSQNIVSSWLTGARYIELKTVQVLDELEVTKPCISMGDEGYNCEWSQELRLHQSLDEYLNALIAIHILKRRLGIGTEEEPGFIFNMSVGYNLEGILSPGVQSFLDKMADASELLAEKIERASEIFAEAKELEINSCISDNITISTMHGCPPEEIEKIGRYFVCERKLNTTIKLNPTLLGPDALRQILNDDLGFPVTVPDIAFEHDLKYDAGVELIKNLTEEAEKNGVSFGVKLTNTLETANDRGLLPDNEQMVYMSGRPLHVISVNLAAKLQAEFEGKLDISFSAGADCYNMADLLGCGLKPITVCSDLLKPGGYGRIAQYLKETTQQFIAVSGSTIEDYIEKRFRGSVAGTDEAALENLKDYAQAVKTELRYHKKEYPWDDIKTDRELTPFDCISAPCKGTCPAGQDVPSYMLHTARGEFEEALTAILKTNPFPNVQGLVCDHPCTEKCTRINYDRPLDIRGVKRVVAQEMLGKEPRLTPADDNGMRVSIIGGGPSGFSAAYFLRLAGFQVDLYEAKSFGGGMAADAIPTFRLDDNSIKTDIDRIIGLGVSVHYDSMVDGELFARLREESDYIYIAVGAVEPYLLEIEGADSQGVLDQLSFLQSVRREENLNIGTSVCIVGGGNSAMDAARTAKRLVGADGRAVVLYRRTEAEMPADREEIEALLAENIELMELVSPEKILDQQGKVTGIVCRKMELGAPDSSGRPRPVPMEGESAVFTLGVDCVISAIGQQVVIPFLDSGLEVDQHSCETTIPGVYAGGDAIRGASTLIKAIGDGQRAAFNIGIAASLTDSQGDLAPSLAGPEPESLEEKMAIRDYPVKVQGQILPVLGFELPSNLLTKQEAIEEAARCLSCDTLCNICTTVCPNRANVGYTAPPFRATAYKVVPSEGKVELVANGTFVVNQTNQVCNIGDFCNECGNCTTFCPTKGAPYLDKPKFYLERTLLESEGEGYCLEGNTIYKMEEGQLLSLKSVPGGYQFKSPLLEASVEEGCCVVTAVNFTKKVPVECDLRVIPELVYLLNGLKFVLSEVVK